jgi:AraC family transcriptional regulator
MGLAWQFLDMMDKSSHNRPVQTDGFPFGGFSSEEARIETLGGAISIVRHHGGGPLQGQAGRNDRHWLELALAPRTRGLALAFPARCERTRHDRFGDLVFIPAGEEVRVWADAAPRHGAMVCEIEPSAFRLWAGTEPHFPAGRPEALLDVASAAIRHLLRRLAEESRHPGLASARLVEALFVQLAIELARYCAQAAEAPRQSGLAGWRLRLIDERIARLDDPPSLGELAALCGMSPRQLTRAFRASRGQSLGEYQLHLRLEAAKRALGGAGSVKEIAFGLGFSSPSRFARAFARSFAITPAEFRRRVLRQRGMDVPNRIAGLESST